MSKYIVVFKNENGDIEYYGLSARSSAHAIELSVETMSYSDMKWTVEEVYALVR